MKHGSERCPGVRAWSIVSCDDLKRANSYSKTRRPPSVSLASSTSRRWRAKSYILPFIICHLSPLPGHGRAADQLHTSAHVSLTATRDESASEKGLGRARRQRYLPLQERALLSELTSHPRCFNTLLHCRPPHLPSSSVHLPYICSINISSHLKVSIYRGLQTQLVFSYNAYNEGDIAAIDVLQIVLYLGVEEMCCFVYLYLHSFRSFM